MDFVRYSARFEVVTPALLKIQIFWVIPTFLKVTLSTYSGLAI